jgi:DNA-directed RNA polymerase subunit RPC12/RpoP
MGDTESDTKSQLLHRIAFLPQEQMARATYALVMIWNGVAGPLDLPPPDPKSTFSPKSVPFPNWRRMQLALLKSIPTGTFIDGRFYAIRNHSVNVKLVEEPCPRKIASGSHLGKSAGAGGQGVTDRTTKPASHVNPPPASTPTVTLPSSSQTTPTPRPSGTAAQVAWLECTRCGTYSRLKDLYEGMRCPICPERSVKKGRPRMKCQLCNVTPVVYRMDCANRKCRVKFV